MANLGAHFRSGPPHAPAFLATVTVSGVSFEGHERPNKKDSERTAAYVALGSLRLDATALMRDPGARPAWEFQGGRDGGGGGGGGGPPTPAVADTASVAGARNPVAAMLSTIPTSSSEDYSTAEDDAEDHPVEDAAAGVAAAQTPVRPDIPASTCEDDTKHAPAEDANANVATTQAPVVADVPAFASKDGAAPADNTEGNPAEDEEGA